MELKQFPLPVRGHMTWCGYWLKLIKVWFARTFSHFIYMTADVVSTTRIFIEF